MEKSLALSLFVLGLSLAMAWAVVYFGRKAHQSEAKLWTLAVLFAVGGIGFASFAYLTDSRQRRITLFERVLVGSDDVEVGAPIAQRRIEFEAEHPGVEHTLHLKPLLGFGEEAGAPVEVQILLVDVDEQVLLEELGVFDVREEGGVRDQRTFTGHGVWDGDHWRFTPTRVGTHRLELGLVHVGIHEIFVRIEDPEKTDGVRAPGY